MGQLSSPCSSRLGCGRCSLCSFLHICSTICPRRLLDVQINGLTNCMPNFFRELWPAIIIHFGRFDESQAHARLSCSERQFVSLLSDGFIVLLNFGLTTLSTSLYPSSSPRFTRLTPVHHDEFPQPIRAVEPAVLLQAPEKSGPTKWSPPTCKLFCTLARRQQETPSPHWHPCRLEDSRLCSGPTNCTGRRTTRTTKCTVSSSLCCHHRGF